MDMLGFYFFQSILNVTEYPLVNSYECEIVAATVMQGEQKPLFAPYTDRLQLILFTSRITS